MQWTCNNKEDLDLISSEILSRCHSKRIAFHGNMGAGKTTLIKHICKQLEVIDVVNSPTFSIVNEYISRLNQTVYHFDFYRIENKQEVVDIGIDTYFDDSAICLVEWPSKIGDLLPPDFVHIYIHQEDDKRIIKLEPND